MIEVDDHELLAQYAGSRSEVAFAALVERHVSLVYSAALRFSGNPHHAQEITQAVFIILARKARNLGRGTVLSGWLYQAARLAAANFVKGEIRRKRREQDYMQSIATEPDLAAWEQVAPLLDEAMGRLGETDRNAVVLRFFENKTTQEVAKALKLNEEAARKRVGRALEKLRKYFAKRGVTLSAAAIAGAVGANSVQAAPPGLAVTVTAGAAKGTAISATITTLVKGTLKIMAYAKLKLALGIGMGILLLGGAATVVLSIDGTRQGPAPGEIIKKAQEKYGSLTSYSDAGRTAATINGMSLTTTFTTKLARPGFYLIEWDQSVTGRYTNKGAVWSAGEGDFLRMGSREQKQASQETALSSATGISGGAAALIPGTFFGMNWGNQLSAASLSAKRQADEKVEDVDCHVLAYDLKGVARTLWIGKQDFLIHQFRAVTSAKALQAAMDQAVKRNPGFAAHLPASKSQGTTSTETHENIVVNQTIEAKDFVPPAAAE
ncbi:MAG: sigma-70 family RNA polymerase sigma factor [Verrucomicrobiota bacterium]